MNKKVGKAKQEFMEEVPFRLYRRFSDERNVWLFYVRMGLGGLGSDGDRMFGSSVCYTEGVLGARRDWDISKNPAILL